MGNDQVTLLGPERTHLGNRSEDALPGRELVEKRTSRPGHLAIEDLYRDESITASHSEVGPPDLRDELERPRANADGDGHCQACEHAEAGMPGDYAHADLKIEADSEITRSLLLQVTPELALG